MNGLMFKVLSKRSSRESHLARVSLIDLGRTATETVTRTEVVLALVEEIQEENGAGTTEDGGQTKVAPTDRIGTDLAAALRGNKGHQVSMRTSTASGRKGRRTKRSCVHHAPARGHDHLTKKTRSGRRSQALPMSSAKAT